MRSNYLKGIQMDKTTKTQSSKKTTSKKTKRGSFLLNLSGFLYENQFL